MSSIIISFVAGGGKTKYSREYMMQNKGGLYLAFTNSVIDEMKTTGLLSLTISSLFSSYILPKMFSHIPIIAKGAHISHNKNTSQQEKMLSAITIENNGNIFNKSTRLNKVCLETNNLDLHNMPRFNSSYHVKSIFNISSVLLNHAQRDALSWYILKKYPEKVISLMKSRFKFVIIDESQDIKRGFMQDFAELLYESNIDLIILGDPYQNVNGGSDWFENLSPSETNNKTYRCPENNCQWIRENLAIDITGERKEGGCLKINNDDIKDYDDGERTLLYTQESQHTKQIINRWSGRKSTIKSAKGSTIKSDVVIIGKTMNIRNFYTAVTRTEKYVYYTVESIN